jgi:UDP-3-O-[3-hydroxymyristoyl] glucosamine N-acyltransferase
MINPFFQNKGPLKIDKIFNSIKVENNLKNLDIEIFDIKDLVTASTNEITFFHSRKYESVASNTKASYCLTTNKLSNILPKNCKPIEVDNVLVSTAMITSMFYPDAITDDFDIHTLDIEKTSFNNSVNHGQNILIGKNVKIGSNCLIGHNTIIESNVVIGDNCSIGSNVIIRNTLIKNNVSILDGCVIGKKGFGFFP